jgi:MscS family membrane protein
MVSMKMLRYFLLGFCLAGLLPAAFAQEASTAAAQQQATTNTNAAAAVTATKTTPPAPDFLEHLVDAVLVRFDVRGNENTVTHFVIAAIFLVVALLLRRAVTAIFFTQLRKLAARTTTTLDDKLLPSLEAPVGTLIMLVGIFAALNVLKLSEAPDRVIGYGATVAFSLVIFWGLLRAFGALLDHAQEIALKRQMGVAAFMPWIKKTLITLFMVLGVLMVVQSLGFDVKALLAGLGIGGLAFALAAQDTLANVFGSVVVAIDQPFKLGEVIKIQGNIGTVEDIGLRSTKLRLIDKSLIVMPNKMVAAESIINLSRFTGRRVEQIIGLTYDTTAAQMEEVVAEFRRLLLAEKEINPDSVICYFRDYNSSSLDIWMVFELKDPDFHKHMQLRQRLNLAFMKTVEARGLAFAFPTQTLHVASLPERGEAPESAGPKKQPGARDF